MKIAILRSSRPCFDAFGPGRRIWESHGKTMEAFEKTLAQNHGVLDFALENER